MYSTISAWFERWVFNGFWWQNVHLFQQNLSAILVAWTWGGWLQYQQRLPDIDIATPEQRQEGGLSPICMSNQMSEIN